MENKKSYIIINDFRDFIHYNDRPVIWLKLYYSILDSVRFYQLTSFEKWIFIGLLLLASKKDNKLLYEKNFLKAKLINFETEKNKQETLETAINSLEREDLIAIKMLSQRYQNACLDKSRVEKSRVDKSRYIVLFNFWNKQKIVEHKKLTNKMETKINSALKEYSLEDIKKSISNYSIVLNGKKYYWSYKWTLEDFLVRGLTKFLDVPLKNFETEESKKLPPLPDGWSKLKEKHNL